MNLISRLLTRLFPNLVAIRSNFKRLAIDYGQWKSIREHMAVDTNGTPIPWYTYPAIEYLTSFDFRDCEVFEFGSGNSSIFWASRTRSVISVENNRAWFEVVNKRKQQNQLVIHRADEDGYVKALSEQGKLFEIVVIDGNWRKPCTVEAINCLKEDGMIVLDNSDRMIEKECSSLLREKGFIQIDFSGFGPINGYCWTTSVFMKNPMFLQQNFSGPTPIGGLGN